MGSLEEGGGHFRWLERWRASQSPVLPGSEPGCTKTARLWCQLASPTVFGSLVQGLYAIKTMEGRERGEEGEVAFLVVSQFKH